MGFEKKKWDELSPLAKKTRCANFSSRFTETHLKAPFWICLQFASSITRPSWIICMFKCLSYFYSSTRRRRIIISHICNKFETWNGKESSISLHDVNHAWYDVGPLLGAHAPKRKCWDLYINTRYTTISHNRIDFKLCCKMHFSVINLSFKCLHPSPIRIYGCRVVHWSFIVFFRRVLKGAWQHEVEITHFFWAKPSAVKG